MSIDAEMTAKVDGSLVQQLSGKGVSSGPVQAWFVLKPSALSTAAGSPAETTSLANSLVERVGKHVGEQAQSFKVLPNLNSFMVSAAPAFVRELVNQPEVASARSTTLPGFGLIAPVKSVPVKIRTLRSKRVSSSKRRQK